MTKTSLDMIKTIIVEDEPLKLTSLKNQLLKEFPEIKIVAECPTVESAIENIKSLKPHLVFLDVELGEKDGGIKVLENTRFINYEVVFTTAHEEHALKAFNFCALHYLLKPFGLEDLKEALKRYKEKIESCKTNPIEIYPDDSPQKDLRR